MTSCHRPEPPAGSAAGRALTVGALTALLALGAAPAAHAAPGDNGDIKVHGSTTPVTDRRDEPQVCRFYLDAFDFDDLQLVDWTIEQQPPTGTQQVSTGVLALLSGTGQTQIMSLPDGHYRVNWTFVGQTGSAKHKVFTVSCPPAGGPSDVAAPVPPPGPGGPSNLAVPSTSPRPSGSPAAGGGRPPGTGGPHGGLEAGGGGTSHDPHAVEVGAGSALLALVAVLGIRAVRRRTARNAAS
ncbi:hypothetical protein GCM10010495_52760 [Kitasatospora herbaricolor]|uniref:hypothetical protein n=1 Tax=Kitasatospora herbaricolor TaxID=68217 RepID=UPI00174A7866|nr:hypothetical protein [Kitasatospora herbaricolor]MDQ0312560.1 hypothetical protein [Kitasatospora herbaricolor]GGV29908.1 hypothetical protein GCM10010495_52760 [Kitasatospora herbaricolor]